MTRMLRQNRQFRESHRSDLAQTMKMRHEISYFGAVSYLQAWQLWAARTSDFDFPKDPIPR